MVVGGVTDSESEDVGSVSLEPDEAEIVDVVYPGSLVSAEGKTDGVVVPTVVVFPMLSSETGEVLHPKPPAVFG